MSSSLHLEIAIVSASGLSAHERKGLEDWFQEEFSHLPYEWAEPEWYAVARSEDGSVGRLAIVQRQVAVVGQPVRVGGVGGVITKPEYRGCGVATALMLNANAFIKDNLGAEFGLLLCRREVAP